MNSTFAQMVLSAVFLANQAIYSLDAIGRTLYRLFISRRKLLEWETAAAAEARLGVTLRQFVAQMGPSLVLDLLLLGLVLWLDLPALLAASPWLALWFSAPLVAWQVSRPLVLKTIPVGEKERRALRRLTRKTWLFFERFVGADDHWLPPDNYQEEIGGKIAHRTSPTNMGLYLLSGLTAHDLGYLTTTELADRLENTLDTFDQLETCRGHFLNWYDTQTLKPLYPPYVSTVDSGNLLGCFITLRRGLLDKLEEPIPNPAILAGFSDTFELIGEGLASARGEVADWLRKEWAAVRPTLATVPSDLTRWSQLLQLLDDRTGHWQARLHGSAADPRLIEWVDRFASSVRHARQEFKAIYTWIEELESFRKYVMTQPLPEQARWREILLSLSVPQPLLDWESKLTQLQSDLAEGHQPEAPRLAAALAASGMQVLASRLRSLAGRTADLVGRADFKFLYNSERDLFSVGYHVPLGRLDNAYYDLLASEAALTSFLSVARGVTPKKHWFHLGRPAIRVDNLPGMLSWGGTMFEYLMPRLLLPSARGTLLETMQRAAVRRQIEYGVEMQVPWGISESAYYRLDSDQNYQYQAFGVPGLGLKRGLGRDLVIAPYATALAVPVEPIAALANLQRLAEIGAEGPYGLYEAIDYTASRLARGEKMHIIKTYMAHHQGMALTAIANRLLGNLLPRRLGKEPAVRAADLLLYERIPYECAGRLPARGCGRRHADDRRQARGSAQADIAEDPCAAHASPFERHLHRNDHQCRRWFQRLRRARCISLSARRHLRDSRTGDLYPRPCHGGMVAINLPPRRTRTRYVRSALLDRQGGVPPPRRDAPHHHGYRRLPGKERGNPKGDAHQSRHSRPAVGGNQLSRAGSSSARGRPCPSGFRQTIPGDGMADRPASPALPQTAESGGPANRLCRTRPSNRPSRSAGIRDRPHSLPWPKADSGRPGRPLLGMPLKGTTGAVLDPVMAIRARVRLEPDSSAVFTFCIGVAESRDAAVHLAEQLSTSLFVNRSYDMAWAHSQVELQQLGISARQAHVYQRIAGHCLFPSAALRNTAAQNANRLGQHGLWPMGISGDLPIILVRIVQAGDPEFIRELLSGLIYLRGRGLTLDIVFLDESPTSYRDELKQLVNDTMRTGFPTGHVWTFKADQMAHEERTLLLATARVILSDAQGKIAEQLDAIGPTRPLPPLLKTKKLTVRPRAKKQPSPRVAESSVLFDNGMGGFAPDGREYLSRGRCASRAVGQCRGQSVLWLRHHR